jgi:polyhydroxyalkanoate synthesis regulator phasin
MAEKDMDSFKSVFGEHYQELLDTLSKKGDFQTNQETIYDNCGNVLGTKNVKRKPIVQPVAGQEVWSDYWVTKFKTSGGIDAFQKCQEELAISAYFDPIISASQGMTVSQKSLCILYDRSVNQGAGYAKNLVSELKNATNEQDYWKNYSQKQKDDIKTRVDKILSNTDMKWEVLYDL